jgi:hypothetical protein
MTGETLSVGWMRVSSNVRLVGHLFYRVVDTLTGETLSEVPILPVTGRSFRTALRPGSNNDLALAIVNLSDTTATFRVTARQEDGGALQTDHILLDGEQHLARFLQEVFQEHSLAMLPSSFKGGTLVIEVVEGNATFVVTLLKTRTGFPLSILPVVVDD